MLQRHNREWRLYPHKVSYTSHDEERTQWALPNKQWWTDTADKHDFITIHEFIDVEVTDEMRKRYEEIKDMPEDFFDIYVEYILTGDTSEDVELPTNHPFNIVRLRKENSKLKDRFEATDSAVLQLMMEGLN